MGVIRYGFDCGSPSFIVVNAYEEITTVEGHVRLRGRVCVHGCEDCLLERLVCSALYGRRLENAVVAIEGDG